VLVGLVLGAFAVGRATAPRRPASARSVAGVHFAHGVPVGFAESARGGGTAASWYVALVASCIGQPVQQARPRLGQIVARGHENLVERLLPEPVTAGDGNIAADVPVRVWTSHGSSDSVLHGSARLTVRVWEVALFGPRSNGQDPPDAGIAGGWHVVTLGMVWQAGRWRLTSWRLDDAPAVTSLTPASATLPPTLTGPDSWTPDTP
jgi:hypothetical protein